MNGTDGVTSSVAPAYIDGVTSSVAPAYNDGVTSTVAPAYIYYTIPALDLVIGTVYLLLALVGTYSNGRVLSTFWSVRNTVKVHPFTLCALVLAANDLLLCTLGVAPNAILILAKRPLSFPTIFCKIFGFVNHFSDRFGWFTITCIMVYRCVTTVFPLRLRSVTYRPFIYILSLLALLQGLICALPFFNLEMVVSRYEYSPNLGECSYEVDGNQAPAMLLLIDLLWWSPFLVCVISCALFCVFMKLHAARVTRVQRKDKSNDARKKTALLTAFFIIAYFPKALLILFDFLMNTERFISWDWFTRTVGDEDKAIKVYVYLNLMCKWVLPAGRAALTPTILHLNTYLKMCDSSRKNTVPDPNSRYTLPSMVTSMSLLTTKLFKVDSERSLKVNSSNDVTRGLVQEQYE